MNVQLSQLERKFLRRTLGNTRDADCVVLVGSVARKTRASPLGDIDVLVINGRARKLLHPGVQTTALTIDTFKERVRTGDDFAQWALRFGVSIRGRTKWQMLQRELLNDAPWPNPAVKLTQALRRLKRAQELMDLGDANAAQEDLLYAASHLARAKLLGLRVFPLSRPELSAQLLGVGMVELASLLEQLHLDNELADDELKRLLSRVREIASAT
jgi:predicted nucleotidyltransferase